MNPRVMMASRDGTKTRSGEGRLISSGLEVTK
jgi:hypothetical protein